MVNGFCDTKHSKYREKECEYGNKNNKKKKERKTFECDVNKAYCSANILSFSLL